MLMSWTKTSKIIKNVRCAVLSLAVVLIAGVALVGYSSQAQALCYFCQLMVNQADPTIWQEAEDEFDEKIDQEFKNLQRFIVHQMWEQSILPVMMLGAEQMTVFALQQAMAIGMFIDAESQMDAQLMLQELRAKAHKDYHPSVGMCEFGSLMKSIAASERRGEVAAVVFAQRSQDRQMGQADTAGRYGQGLDQDVRIWQFRELFCNEKSRNAELEQSKGEWTGLVYACSSATEWADAGFDQPARLRMDKDIDYFSLMDSPWTMKINLTNREIEDTSANPQIHDQDEEHVMAMASNLFAHETFPRIPARLLQNRPSEELNSAQKGLMDMRSIIAKRSVAENSFYAISALKAQGHQVVPSSTPPDFVPMNARLYMEHILAELGVPAAEIMTLLGENPSYYAQMEVLTKKLYQNPDFYTNLYDKPANVERKTTALQAIKLMQKFDILKSSLRAEASVSVLLELAVMDLQGEIEDQIRAIGLDSK